MRWYIIFVSNKKGVTVPHGHLKSSNAREVMMRSKDSQSFFFWGNDMVKIVLSWQSNEVRLYGIHGCEIDRRMMNYWECREEIVWFGNYSNVGSGNMTWVRTSIKSNITINKWSLSYIVSSHTSGLDEITMNENIDMTAQVIYILHHADYTMIKLDIKGIVLEFSWINPLNRGW